MTRPFDLDRIGGAPALDRLIAEVIAAGDAARRMFEEGRASVTIKPDRSPVTAADRMVEERLSAHLARACPACGFLGEETGLRAGSDARLSFVLDPIDGTRAFMRGLTTWSVLLALLEDDEPVLGVAYLPAEADLYVAVAGQGAHGNGRRLRVSQVASLTEASFSHGALAQFHTDGSTKELLALGAGTHSQRGLTDFDGYRRLLQGRIDAVVDPAVTVWDVAAAAILVREAGGCFTDMNGRSTVRGRGAIASNGLVHDALVEGFARRDDPL
ncbi:MAG: inositol monophosphatase family protein [Deltaproteobacteria bacterium]